MSTGAGSGGERSGGFNGLLVALLVISIIFAVVDFGWLSINANQDAKASALVTRIQVLSQQLSRQANDAAGGNIDAFGSLNQTRDTIADLLNRLKKGDVRTGMAPSLCASACATRVSSSRRCGQCRQATTGCAL